MITSAVFTLPDGGTIGYAEYGDPKGHPLFVLHGVPGSRFTGQILHQAAQLYGVRLIAPERPGFGLSSKRRIEILDYPHELLQLATGLNIERFAVLGISGGLPYALACAYVYPQRVASLGVVSGIGPQDLPDLTSDMHILKPWAFWIAREYPFLFAAVQRLQTWLLIQNAKKELWQGKSPIPEINPETIPMLIADQSTSFASGIYGVAEDARRLSRNWGFRVQDVNYPVYFWFGERDQHIPLPLARYVVGMLPNCQAIFYPNEDHFQPILLHAQEILQTLLRASLTENDAKQLA